MTGRKLHIIPSKSPVHMKEDEEVYSTGPAKQMKQVRKGRSEKSKFKLYASAQDLGARNTKWHVSLSNVHNVQESSHSNVITSPKRRASPLPPPPSNPPPILDQTSDKSSGSRRERELVKSVSTGTINIISHAEVRVPRKVTTPQDVIKPFPPTGTERDKTVEGSGQHRKGPPPKLPPPYSPKARAAAVVSTAIQDHMQSSTRSAPGQLQKNIDGESNVKVNENESDAGHMRSESASNALKTTMGSSSDIQEGQRKYPIPLKPIPHVPPTTPSEDQESELTASMEGGVKSLARYFSKRSKESLAVQSLPTKQSKVLRQVKGRQVLKSPVRNANTIPEMCEEEAGTPVIDKRMRPLPPIKPISEASDENYQVLQNVCSMVSTGSPTHMSIFSWYNPDPESSLKGEALKRRYQNVFDDESFAVFDKTGGTEKEKEVTTPKSPYKEYQNVLVDTATLEGQSSDYQSDKEGSHKDKKPKPLPRTLSKEAGIEIQAANRGRHLSTSNSEGSLSVSSSYSSVNMQSTESAGDIASSVQPGKQDSHTPTQEELAQESVSPDMVVMGSLDDPEWREKYEELIEREIEMSEELSETEGGAQDHEEREGILPEKQFGVHPTMDVVPPPPFVPAKKAVLKKTQSHNLHEPNIRRRNTPKEKRELRKGICSDTDELDETDIEDYVSMKSVTLSNTLQHTSMSHSEMSSSLTVPKPTPGFDPRSSTYYLKILPYETPPAMVKPVETPTTNESATRAKHYYIEVDIPDEPSGAFEPQHAGKDAQRNPTLPPKSTHKADGALATPHNPKRKLKYPKINIAPPTDGSIVHERNAGKIPYLHVKVDSDTTKAPTVVGSGSPPTSGRQQSQGSTLAEEMVNYEHRPLPPTPSQTAIYYKTVSHPLGHIPAMRQFVHHEYIEIDEEELNRKAQASSVPVPKAAEGWINIHAVGGPVRMHETIKRTLTTLPPPPPIPERPSCPYVEIDAEEIEEMAPSLSHSSVPDHKTREDRDGNHVGLQNRPNKGPRAARKLGPPPSVPGRPEHVGRQRSFSSSGEYAYPVIPGLKFQWMNTQRGGNQAYFAPRVPLPVASHATHRSAATGKKSLMATIKEKGEGHTRAPSDEPPTVPPKTESLLREQQGLLLASSVTKPSPYLVPVTRANKARKMSAPDIYNHLVNPAAYPAHKMPYSTTIKEHFTEKSSKHDTEDDERTERGTISPNHLKQLKKTMYPPLTPPPYLKSVEAKQKAGTSHPPKVPKRQKKVSREEHKDMSPAAMQDPRQLKRELEKKESSSVMHRPPEPLAVRNARLQHRIDRKSLDMIMRNKAAIAKQLQKETDSPMGQRRPVFENEAKQDESVVRHLGDILLDIDSLLQRRMCSEDDLIAAIENQLNIKLVKKTQSSSDAKQSEDKSDERQNHGDTSVQVTEQDVKEVVSFMNSQESQTTDNETPLEINVAATSEGGGEEGDGWMERATDGRSSIIIKEDSTSEVASPKHRSSTFIIIADPELPSAQQTHTTTHLTGSPPEEHLQDTHAGHLHAPSQPRVEDEEGSEKNIRDSRSSSVGLKPLRRVKARRRTNPPSDMVNLSPGKGIKHKQQ